MISLAILAGGVSSRMGQDKALRPFLGQPLILRILNRLKALSEDIFISANHPTDFAFLGIPIYADRKTGCGALGGIYTSLLAAKHPLVAVVGCDMPFADLALIEHEREIMRETDVDVVVPSTPQGLEPLHAVYRCETCLPVVWSAMEAGERKLVGWFPKVKVHTLSPEETAQFTPRYLAFWNLNAPEEFRQAEEVAANME
jgi:molybdopterin-guanine dinucleotide biosynthesis protein A